MKGKMSLEKGEHLQLFYFKIDKHRTLTCRLFADAGIHSTVAKEEQK